MSFGQRLQQVRKANDLTQEAFAEQLRVSRQAVSKWESAKGYPEIEKIIYICNRYGVTMDELFCDEVLLKERPAPAVVPEKLENHPLRDAVSSFLANRSPRDRRIVHTIAAVLAAVLVWFFLYQLERSGNEMMIYIWIAAMVVFGIAEAVTAGLVCIWFVLGSVAALVATVAGGALWVQCAAFLVVSIATLIATRPLVKKMQAKSIVPTNADRVLQQCGRVTEAINNEDAAGAVYIDGKTWTARSENGEVIPADALVEIVRMEGVKLFVKRKGE